MALAIAYEDAVVHQIRREKPTLKEASVKTRFFGSRDNPHAPHADLNHYDPGRSSYSGTHFHVRDQFQVVVAGRGRIGRHDLSPYCVHFTRAYTPYGPLVTDGTGLTFMVMRAHFDPGSQHLPEKQSMLTQVADRRPWQISRPLTFPVLQTGRGIAGMTMQPVPGVSDENGLAAYTLTMEPHARALAPDPSNGDGQYLIVTRGSLSHGDREHKALALVFIETHEAAFPIHAGAEGLQAIILNFPQVKAHTVSARAPATATGFRKWQCELCAFSYDEAAGMPGEGIPAGTRWVDVPDTWSCPDCAASKNDFQMVEI